MDRIKFNPLYILLAILAINLIRESYIQSTHVRELTYSEFQHLLEEKKIDQLEISDKIIRGKFKEPQADKKTEFTTIRLEPELANQLEKSSAQYSRIIDNTIFKDLMSWILPAVIFVSIWVYLGRKMMEKGGGGLGGGLMSIGKSKAKLYVETDVKVTFADVAGVDESKEELKEVVDFLKNPDQYGTLGARMPKGILLIGPPGTGKTLLAKAVAGEAGVPFFSISGSEFVEMFVGVGAARVRDLFEQARLKAPCIIFIDELDSLGKARSSHFTSGGYDEKEQTLNQLLAELDGFDTKSGIILLAATNRPEILDPALLRAGRFDRQVLVDRPDKIGREQILLVHLKKIKTAADLNMEQVASLTPGFTGADLANLVNEAALVATRRHSSLVELQDFTLAIERIVAGLEKKNRLLNPKEKETVAYHEMGHALVASALPGSDKVHKISIIPRGIGALGYTIQRPTEDRFLMSKNELINKMAILLGGRTAEELIYHRCSTGASDDLVKVTDIADALVTKYGMNEDVGPIVFEQQDQSFLAGPSSFIPKRQMSEETARIIDQAIKKEIEAAHQLAIEIISQNLSILEAGAKQLLEKETLVENDLKEIFKNLSFKQSGKT